MANADAGKIVLALNSGSSSLKFGLYRAGSTAETLLSGEAESIGGDAATFAVRDGKDALIASETLAAPGPADAVRRIARALAEAAMPAPDAIGHRIVHGGPSLRRHCLIDDAVMRTLEAAAAFAPLHTPAALAVIDAARAHFPRLAQVACLDTAFHATLPDVARVLPLPAPLRQSGVQRYGFHGLSCESIVRQLGPTLPDRLVIAHLGNGASITAVKAGKSIDTSMGLTPTGGIVMGARTGDLDPGVLIYLLRQKGFDAAALADLVDRRSGLLGISGISGDMRRLHEAAAANPDARLAIAIFCYSARKQVAAMIAALEGIDLLVITGGIGENDAAVRASICAGLEWAGLDGDAAPRPHATVRGRRATTLVLASQEEKQIALHTAAILKRR